MRHCFLFRFGVAQAALTLFLSSSFAAATPPAADSKQASSTKVESAQAGDAARMGLTIMGDRETPLGLFITPWKNAYPPQREDRPALLLDETAKPLDPEAFRRQSNYDEAFSTYRKSGALP
jgi:hypothetical protein